MPLLSMKNFQKRATPTGRRFGRLVVLKIAGTRDDGKPIWKCKCDCGKLIEVISYNVTSGRTSSCGAHGCRVYSTPRKTWCPEYELWARARCRSQRFVKRLSRSLTSYFNIDLSDIVIPKVCPILGIPLTKGVKRVPCNNSPSLDRIDSTKGYVKGNVQVISHRANRLKSDASLQELQLVMAHLQKLNHN